MSHEDHEELRYDCAECEAEMLASMRAAGTGGTSYSKAELNEGLRLRGQTDTWTLHSAIKEQRDAGGYVIAPLSMLRCSECDDLLDAYGWCQNHGPVAITGDDLDAAG